MEFRIEFNGTYFDVKLTGTSTVDDCRRYLDQLTSHENFKPGSLILSDETELVLQEVTTPLITEMAGILKSKKDIFGTARFAACVGSELTYGINRMFQGYTKFHWDGEIRAFRSRPEAITWLLGKSEK